MSIQLTSDTEAKELLNLPDGDQTWSEMFSRRRWRGLNVWSRESRYENLSFRKCFCEFFEKCSQFFQTVILLNCLQFWRFLVFLFSKIQQTSSIIETLPNNLKRALGFHYNQSQEREKTDKDGSLGCITAYCIFYMYSITSLRGLASQTVLCFSSIMFILR